MNNSPRKVQIMSHIKFNKPTDYSKISLKLLHNKDILFAGLENN